MKTCTELPSSVLVRQRVKDGKAALEGPTTQTCSPQTKQLLSVASGVRSLFLLGPHGKQTVLIKSPLLVRTRVHWHHTYHTLLICSLTFRGIDGGFMLVVLSSKECLLVKYPPSVHWLPTHTFCNSFAANQCFPPEEHLRWRSFDTWLYFSFKLPRSP